MTVAELKRGVVDGTFVRNTDGSVRPTSLREQLGLSVVRRFDRKRGITAQDIMRRENLRKMAYRHFKYGHCFECQLLAKCQHVGKLTDNTRCFSPDGQGGCKNKVEGK